MSRILSVTDLWVSYYLRGEEIPALRGVDLFLDKGESLGIAGESGCGKSTLASAILRLIPPSEGKFKSGMISFNNKDIISLPYEEIRGIRGCRISLVMQDPYSSFNPVIKIGRQLIEAATVHGASEAAAEKEAEILLEEVGLKSEIMGAFPHQLSGGMLQRASIAASLINKPDILIADEPTSSLDVTVQKKIAELLISLKERFSLSLIFITHNLNLLSQISDRVYTLYAGEVVESAPTSELFADPAHPYTKGLIQALPDIRASVTGLKPIPGSIPSPSELPTGCSFSPRCPYSFDKCSAHPDLKRKNASHLYRCYL